MTFEQHFAEDLAEIRDRKFVQKMHEVNEDMLREGYDVKHIIKVLAPAITWKKSLQNEDHSVLL
jgi:hypothetical protein